MNLQVIVNSENVEFILLLYKSNNFDFVCFVVVKDKGKNMVGVLGMVFIFYYNQLMIIFEINDELKKSVKGIFKQMVWVVGGIVVGGVLLGFLGVMIGGVVGFFVGYMCLDEYIVMIKVLKNFND